MLIYICMPTITACGFMAVYGSSPVKVSRISLGICLRSKPSSLEEGKWNCYVPEMSGSLWHWKLWCPVWNLAHITLNAMKDVSSCHTLSRTRCSLWSGMLWEAKSGYSLPALEAEKDGLNIKEATKIWRLARGRWEQAEEMEVRLVWCCGYVDSVSEIPCGERRTWRESLAAVNQGRSWRPGVGKLESTRFSIIRGFSEMKVKLDMLSLYTWISCCTTPPGVGLYLTFTSGC